MVRSSPHLLVVDDSEPIRRAVMRLLHGLGFRDIDQAADGVEALTHFQRTPYAYDLVLTDWDMPNATGIDLVRAIRASAQRPETPVLVLTGNATEERMSVAIEAGASGFVAKPFQTPSLREKVLSLLSAYPAASDGPELAAAGR